MNKYFGLTIGLTVLGTVAFAGGSNNSLEGAINNMAQGQQSAPGTGGTTNQNIVLNGIGNTAGPGYGTLMMPVPEPAGMVALSVAIGSLLLRKRKSSNP